MNLLKSAVLGTSVLAGIPTAAMAHHHDVHVEIGLPGPVVVESDPGRVWVAPVYRTVIERQWVEAVVRQVEDRVWVPAVTQEQTAAVYVPDVYGVQDVVVYDGRGHRHLVQQQVLITPAHTENRCVQVVVAPGHYAIQCHQEVVTPAHFADVARQEVVCEGHWEQPGPVIVERPHARISIPLPF